MSTETKYPPTIGQRYRLDEIIKDLSLPDSAFLTFEFRGRKGTIQDSHITNEQLLTVPGIESTQWKYLHTTNEECPIFVFAGSESINHYIDLEPSINMAGEDDGTWWATPKGFPRDQTIYPIT